MKNQGKYAMVLCAAVLLVGSAFNIQTNEKGYVVNTLKPFLIHFEQNEQSNNTKVWLSTNTKDSLFHRSFITNNQEYDEKKLNNYLKVVYTTQDDVHVLQEECEHSFNWIKIQTPGYKFVIDKGKFPTKAEVLAKNKQLNNFNIAIQFELNLNKLRLQQVIETKKKISPSSIKVKAINVNIQENIQIQF